MDEHLQLVTSHAQVTRHQPAAASSTRSRVTAFPGCFAWLQVTAARLLAWTTSVASSWPPHSMEMCPARSIVLATPHCSWLRFQSLLLPCLFIMLLSKDFAGDARGKKRKKKKNPPQTLVISSCKWVSSLVTSLAQSDLRFFHALSKITC